MFINGLIENCLSLDIGAKIKGKNVSIVGYCDDILLLSPNDIQMNRLLEECSKYAREWKLEFNPSKSNYTSFGKKTN